MQSFIGIHLLIRDGFAYKHKVFSPGDNSTFIHFPAKEEIKGNCRSMLIYVTERRHMK